MKSPLFKSLCTSALLFLAIRARADYSSLTVTVTNVAGIPTNGSATLTVNSDTRTGTNIISSNPSKFWLGTNSQLKATTNLYNHLALYPFGSGASRLLIRWRDTNSFVLDGQIDQTISSSLAGNWGTLTLITTPSSNTIPVVVPASAYAPATATNVGS